MNRQNSAVLLPQRNLQRHSTARSKDFKYLWLDLYSKNISCPSEVRQPEGRQRTAVPQQHRNASRFTTRKRRPGTRRRKKTPRRLAPIPGFSAFCAIAACRARSALGQPFLRLGLTQAVRRRPQQALVAGGQRSRGVYKLLRLHLGLLHFQFRISGMSWPYLSMYCLCSMSLSLSCCFR